MIGIVSRNLAVLFAGIAVAACAPGPRIVEPVALESRWRIEGRLAVSDGREGGSGSVTWEQVGARYTISLRAPVGGQSWRLSGDDAVCVLEGLYPEPVTAASPEQLLAQELGWQIPLGSLRAWLWGRPMQIDTPVERDEEGRIVGFVESGWRIDYRDFRGGRPMRIRVRKSPYQVQLAIRSFIVWP